MADTAELTAGPLYLSHMKEDDVCLCRLWVQEIKESKNANIAQAFHL